MGTTETMQRRAAKFLSLIAFIAIVLLIGRSLLFPPPPVSIQYADGTFINGSCGVITLSSGIMRWERNEARYTLGEDKVGMYALTDHQLESSTPQQNCRLNTNPKSKIMFAPRDRPIEMTIMDNWGKTYSFARVSPISQPAKPASRTYAGVQ